MHPRGAPQAMSSRPAGQNTAFRPRDEIPAQPIIHILSVGRVEPGSPIRDALLNVPSFRVSFVHDYRELWDAPRQLDVHAVILHNSLCSFELQEAARLVRGRWPHATIVVIRSGQLTIDRALYDRRLHAPVHQDDMRQQIFTLIREGEHRGNH